MRLVRSDYGEVERGQVTLYTLENNQGYRVSVHNYGATLSSVMTPDKKGSVEEITLGFPNLKPYLGDHPYFGSTVGRVAGRINKGEFALGGESYRLSKNEKGVHHLHGGDRGFSKRYWQGGVHQGSNHISVHFTYESADGEEGYPGNLRCEVIYTLSEENELIIEYKGVTDRQTPVNLTNHTYWNLTGDLKRDILGHRITMDAGYYLPSDDGLIPTGEIVPVNKTAFDLRKPKQFKNILKSFKGGEGGVDHSFYYGSYISTLPISTLPQNELKDNVSYREGSESSGYSESSEDSGYSEDKMYSKVNKRLADIIEPKSKRRMTIESTQLAGHLYTGHKLNQSVDQAGIAYSNYMGFCVEAQGLPDAVNHSSFPSIVLKPNDEYYQKTVHRFSVI